MLIRTENLQKIYRTDEIETTSLGGINLEIEQGEFVAIMGPSGCGKSTLLNLLGLLDSPSGGFYHLMGHEVSAWPESKRAELRKANIGFIFQSFNLIDELSVYENIELPLLYLKLSSVERRNRVLRVMEETAITHRARHFPQQLSGGQQQRVAVSRAIVTRPKLILADEPTGNLDSRNGEEVMRLLTELNELGTTVVMVTHSLDHAKYSHRIVQLFDGKVVSEKFANASATAFKA